jgi:uncharacterized protein (DUF433 family)
MKAIEEIIQAEGVEKLLNSKLTKYVPSLCPQKTEPKPYQALTTKELEELYNQSDLEFTFVSAEIIKLQAIRRDKVPTETLISWYQEFLRMGWTKKDFLKAVEGVKRSKIYGAIDFTNFLEAEKFYTEKEVEIIIQKHLESEIKKGEKYLEDSKCRIKVEGEINLTEEKLKAIKQYILKTIKTYYEADEDFKIAETIEKVVEELKKTGKLKQKFYREIL